MIAEAGAGASEAGAGASEAVAGAAEAGAGTAGAGAGAGMAGALLASSASLLLFVRREGAVGSAEVTAAGNASVARLKELIQAKLPSLRDKDACDLTLHVAEVDAGDNVVSVVEAALPSRKTLAEVKLPDGASIVVRFKPVAEAASMPIPGA